MIGATYALIDDPAKPENFRSLATLARALAKMRNGRKVKMWDSLLVWGQQPDERRECVSVEFMAPEATPQNPIVEARVVVVTGRGEQRRTVFAAMIEAANQGAKT